MNVQARQIGVSLRFGAFTRTLLQGSLSLLMMLASSAANAAPSDSNDEGAPSAPAAKENAPSASPDVYIGVSPGSGNRNPLPKPETSSPKLVWTGFVPSETGGRVFLQTSTSVTYAVKDGGKQLELTLHNCRIHLKNNERDLNTSYFDTPVAGVKTRQHKRDVQVVISLKTPVTAVPRTEDGPDGTKFVVLDFPMVKAAAQVQSP